MKTLAAIAAATLLITATLPAEAQFGGRDRPRGAERMQQERPLPPDRRQAIEERRTERRGEERPGRALTPEERRQLRRDIGEHGREIYRERPGRRR